MASPITLNDNKVALGLLVDKSGSMSAMDTREVCASLNNLIDEQMKTGKEILVWLSTFDDKYDTIYKGIEGKDAKVRRVYINPRGLTAIYDAMNTFITDLGADLRDMSDRPGKVVVVILTDGEENSSKMTDRTKVMDMVREQQEKYSWEFVFLGANQDAIGNGAKMGIDSNAACTFDYSAAGCARVLRSTSNAVARAISGQTPRVEFTQEERDESQMVAPVPDSHHDSFELTSMPFAQIPYDEDDDEESQVTRTNAGLNSNYVFHKNI